VTVKKTGTRAGDEVAQLYLTPPEYDTTLPRLMLRCFQRVSLPDESLTFWNIEANRFDVARGEWGVQVGASSSDIHLRTAIHR
jgi:beta-glucosidase